MKVKYISLRKKLVLSILVLSTIVTTIIIIVTFLFDYSQEVQELNQAAAAIEASLLKPLAKLAWDYNDTQIQTQLESITKLNEIASAELTYTNNSKTFKVSDSNYLAHAENNFKSYDLTYESEDGPQKVATLKLEFNKARVYNKLFDKAFFYIGLQFFKSLLISFLLLSVFQILVTSKLEAIVKNLRYLTITQFKNRKKIKFKSFLFIFNARDEISDVTRMIFRMSYKTYQYHQLINEQLVIAQQQVESERARSIYASKMAALGEMASGIAHEVNNPLAVIEGRISLMAKYSENMDSETRLKFNKDLESMLNMSNRISKIVRGLKKFAREGSQDPMEAVSIQTIINDTNTLLLEKIKMKGIDYQVKTSDVIIECRPVEISQVLLNLVSNAIDAIEFLDEKWIKIETENFNNHLLIRIIDSGAGISSEIQDKIMQPFFTTKEIGKGTGLGLSISKGIIENHQGTFRINSKYHNTCFEILIPLQQAQIQNQTA